MRYLLLIAGDESASRTMSQADGEAMTAEYGEFGKAMAARGVLLGGERLRPTSDATTVRMRNGEVLTTDGPFAETKEQLAGYYMVDCNDLDEAIEVASKIPAARNGSIEVRPIWEL
jgi:hypothetical protein